MNKMRSLRLSKQWMMAFGVLFVAIAIYLIFSLSQFYQAHKNFVQVNFDSVYNTRAMLKGRLLAEKFLASLQAVRRYADADQLRQAAVHLDTLILQEQNFSYDSAAGMTTANWLAPRLQTLQQDLVALSSLDAGALPGDARLEQLIAATRRLVGDMDDAERSSWGALSAVNGSLNERLDAIGDQVAAIASLFILMTAVMTWLLFKKAVAESRLKTAIAAEEIILERSPVGIVVTAPNGTEAQVVRANPRFGEIAGRPMAQLIGAGFYDVIAPIDAPGLAPQALRQTLAFGDALTVEGRTAAGADTRWYKVTCKAVDAGSLDRGIIWLFDDITERKLAEQRLRDNEKHFRSMLEASPIAVRITIADGHRVLYANQRYRELLNVDPQTVTRVDPQAYYTQPQDYQDTLARLARGEAVTNKLVELRHADAREGTTWHLASYFHLRFAEQDCIIGWFYDVTALRNANEELQLAYLVYQTSSEAMTVTDAQGRIITVNPAFTRLTGYAADEVVGRGYREVLHSARHDEVFYTGLQQAVDAAGHWEGELWCRRKSGEDFAAALTINSTHTETGLAHRRVMLFSDITEKKRSAELIWQQANFDAVTGLPNRRMFHERLEQAIRASRRSGLPVALMFLDLDRFKDVNDSLGHDMGDTLLKEAAQRLSDCVRDTDTVARLGGDEFTLVLTELQDPANVERVAQAVLTCMAEPFRLGMEDAYVTASLGITLFPDDGASVEALLKNADQAMYHAKNEGRNRRSYFTPALQASAQHRSRMIHDLHVALAQDQLKVYYQPIVDLRSGTIRKAEALIRWVHPTHGMISPAEFIPIAEDTGLINSIGAWVFEQAAAQTARWRERFHPDFQVSVNVSPVQFRNEQFSHQAWAELLQSLCVRGPGIAVEITEGLLLDAGSRVTERLLGFRDAGIQVALDDFGTGYSSLSYLKKFDIDYIKIDRSFVRNLAPGSSDLALPEAMISMAHKLGLEVIAEGVETDLQRDLLREAGCDYAQGFLYSKPVPADSFEQLLAGWRAA